MHVGHADVVDRLPGCEVPEGASVRSPSYVGPAMAVPSRNAPCPCGSGLKYKRCCLAAEQAERADALLEDAVGTRILRWTTECFPAQVEAAEEEFGKTVAGMNGAELQIFPTWLCSDRELTGGGTPAERYAAREDLHVRERAVAARIAGARLSLQRASAVHAGHWLELEDVLAGSRVRVRSAEVSRRAARWDVLLCRVMPDDHGASLWGPAVFFAPDEEPELIAEVERLAAAHRLRADRDGMSAVFRLAALELMRFAPASRGVEPSFYTAEGDPLASGHASWRVADPQAVFELLDRPPELAWVGESEDGSGETFQWTLDRAQGLAGRRSLPPGAVCFESSLTELPGRLCLATFVLAGQDLRCDAISEARLDAAIELIDERVGAVVELRGRTVEPLDLDRSRANGRATPRRSRGGLSEREARQLERELIDEHFRRWLDEPLEPLNGHTPREAARVGLRSEVELLLRGIENRAERTRRAGRPWPELGWLREELGLRAVELAAR